MEHTSYPVRVEIPHQGTYSRWLALATLLGTVPKIILLIPHLIILAVLRFAAFVAGVFGQFAVLFTGQYPKGLFEFVVGVVRWQMRVSAYIFGLTDTYPPFRLE